MSPVDREVPVYPIGVVQKLTGLSGRQIRYYEKVGLLSPHRTQGNQRLYSPKEVDLLLEIKALLAEGLNIEGVKTRLAEGSRDQGAGTQGSGVEPTSARLGPIDHDYVITQMRAGSKLSSLFPVNNQAELERYLRARRARRDG